MADNETKRLTDSCMICNNVERVNSILLLGRIINSTMSRVNIEKIEKFLAHSRDFSRE